ncbi:hypothetical protein N7494_006377 [Penicillium frequentans]|uniref:Uncharacterized protein n=1 Tax=Penicillium frequentans TaxID=3151616 RepID=A0AAD6CXK9_9EURO|nr:hypothetical protein N7494_006377 [Penicillium glabrum]
MSSALNHVRGLSGVPSLRAAQRRHYACRKNFYGDALSNHNDLLRSIRRAFHSGFSHALKPQLAQIDLKQQDGYHAEANKPSIQLPKDPQHPRQPHTQKPYSRLSKTFQRYQPTPSDYLSESLRSAGHVIGSGRTLAPAAIDLDHVFPKKEFQNNPSSGPLFVRESLQTTLGEYIRLVEPLLKNESYKSDALDIALMSVFRKSSHRYLTARGYDVEDVTAWAWILTSNNSLKAVSRIFALEADGRARTGSMDGPRVPAFITLFLLKERYLEPHVLRLLLIHSLHLMSGEPLPAIGSLEGLETNAQTEQPVPKVDVTTCAKMVARLIRHARQVWPEAFPVIARAFAGFLTRPNSNEVGKSNSERAKIDRFKTRKFNECLWKLSLPTKLHPFRSAFIQQQAQFELLRAMATHKPVLPVTRSGYRAVVAVQLAHKKTTAERQSADLKAPSWPPWKEEKLGMDAQRGNEGLHSRAMNVLSQMKEAGYSPQLWEEITAILAGWDSDGSPTVQTRALALRRPSLLEIADDRNRHLIWVARIRATRTVREAWACFLSYQDHGLPPKGVIYAAMAEKLIFRQKAIHGNFDLASHALPGDGLEVHPEPASARDIIYVRTEPPTLDDFLDEMISQGFRPSGRLLALLLQSAASLPSGLAYLQCSNLTDDQILALCTVWRQPPEHQKSHLKALESVSDILFGSFIQFLCRHSRTTVATYAKDIFMADRPPQAVTENQPLINLLEYREHEGQIGHPMALRHAIQLVKSRQPPCRWAWHILLSAFCRDPVQGYQRTYNKRYNRILAWHGMLEVLNWMRARNIEIGPDDFQPLCVAFYRAVDAGIHHPLKVGKALKLYQISKNCPEIEGGDAFDILIEGGLLLLKTQFDQLVLPSMKTSSVAERGLFGMDNKGESPLDMPALLHVPDYATLHSFVRAMGIVGDDDGLLHLLRWMSRSADQLNELAEERLNGEQMMRQTLVAIRLYLEKLEPQSIKGDRIASDCKVQEAYDIVSRTLGWEWPSDVEVEEYLIDV